MPCDPDFGLVKISLVKYEKLYTNTIDQYNNLISKASKIPDKFSVVKSWSKPYNWLQKMVANITQKVVLNKASKGKMYRKLTNHYFLYHLIIDSLFHVPIKIKLNVENL